MRRGPPEPGERLLDQARARRVVSHVDGEGQRLPPGRLDGPGRLPRAGRVEIDADHRGALGAERERSDPPDPRAGSRHDRDLAVHAHIASSAVRPPGLGSGGPTIAKSVNRPRGASKNEYPEQIGSGPPE